MELGLILENQHGGRRSNKHVGLFTFNVMFQTAKRCPYSMSLYEGSTLIC